MLILSKGIPMMITPEQRTKHGFELCDVPSEGGDCEDCKQNPEGEALYFQSDGGYDYREGHYRCESCTDDIIAACIADLAYAETLPPQPYIPFATQPKG